MHNKKKTYVAPQVQVLEARVERGFAGSFGGGYSDPYNPNGLNDDQLEGIRDNWESLVII